MATNFKEYTDESLNLLNKYLTEITSEKEKFSSPSNPKSFFLDEIRTNLDNLIVAMKCGNIPLQELDNYLDFKLNDKEKDIFWKDFFTKYLPYAHTPGDVDKDLKNYMENFIQKPPSAEADIRNFKKSKLTASDIIDYFSDTLVFVRREDFVYVVDVYNYDNENLEDFVYNKLKLEDVLAGNVTIADLVPELYVDDYFDWLLRDDLPNTYKIPDEVLDTLSSKPFYEWDKVIENKKCEVPFVLEEICPILRGEKVGPLDIDKIKKQDDFIEGALDKYLENDIMEL